MLQILLFLDNQPQNIYPPQGYPPAVVNQPLMQNQYQQPPVYQAPQPTLIYFGTTYLNIFM